MRTNRLRTVITAFLAGLVLTSCGGESESPERSGAAAVSPGASQDNPTTAGVDSIVAATSLPFLTLDGIISNRQEINTMIYAALTRYNVEGEVEPDLAESWESNDDATEWTFKLRPNLTFSDGTPLTADDVVYTMETGKATEESTLSTHTSQIEKVVADGEDLVTFTLSKPNAIWYKNIAFLPILSQDDYEQRKSDYGTAPLGAGPYKVAEFGNDEIMKLSANDHYWDTQPAIPTVTIQAVPDETTRMSGLQAGQFDVAAVSGPNIPTSQGAGKSLATGPAPQVVYLGYTMTNPLLDNDKLREAVGLVIDREGLVEAVLGGAGEPASQLSPPTVFGYDPELAVDAYDVEKAKQLVAESGYDGTEIELTYPSGAYVPQVNEVAQVIGQSLQDVGINVKLNRLASDAFFDSWFAKKLPGIWLMSHNMSTIDASNVFQFTGTVVNTFDDPEFDVLYEKQLAEVDQDARLADLQQLGSLMNENSYYTPIFYPENNFAYEPTKITVPFEPSGFIVPQRIVPAG